MSEAKVQNISEDILIKASRGDTDAFEKIYRATSGFVYNVAFRIANNKEDAEEVTQEVFLTIYRKLKNFRFQSSFRTWVYKITTNSAINYSKKRSKEKNRTVEYNDDIKIVNVHGEMEEKIDKEHQEETITSMLEILNPGQRACIVLRNIEGLSYQEIAESLEININTVRSRLKRAREILLAHSKQRGVENEV
jgi:RNA polymerase sigma-70 factor (ECF subfamily)